MKCFRNNGYHARTQRTCRKSQEVLNLFYVILDGLLAQYEGTVDDATENIKEVVYSFVCHACAGVHSLLPVSHDIIV